MTGNERKVIKSLKLIFIEGEVVILVGGRAYMLYLTFASPSCAQPVERGGCLQAIAGMIDVENSPHQSSPRLVPLYG